MVVAGSGRFVNAASTSYFFGSGTSGAPIKQTSIVPVLSHSRQTTEPQYYSGNQSHRKQAEAQARSQSSLVGIFAKFRGRLSTTMTYGQLNCDESATA